MLLWIFVIDFVSAHYLRMRSQLRAIVVVSLSVIAATLLLLPLL